MAKFLNTSAVTYHLEELIKNAHERLVLISPYLRFNDRIRELLEDRDRLKIDIRIVYGKNELQPDENNWLKSLAFVRTSFCKNLHAKCYINESRAIITSMNLYEFSQVNNNEMGVLIERENDGPLYMETYQEAQRLIRISDEFKVTVERVAKEEEKGPAKGAAAAVKSAPVVAEPIAEAASAGGTIPGRKITSSQLAKNHKLSTKALLQKFAERGWVVAEGENHRLTAAGIEAGGELRKGQHGEYFLWPEDLGV